MKKRIFTLITALLIFAALTLSVSAAGTTATTEAKTCARGDTVTLNVSVSSTSGVNSGAVEVIFDSTKLQLVEAAWNTPGSLLSTFDDATNKGAFAFQAASTVSGKIFTVKFKALSDAPLGDTDVQCKIQLKAGSTDLSVTNIAGKITVTCKHNFTKEDTTYPAGPATCTSGAKYYHSCAVCGEKGTTTFTVGNPTDHSFDKKVQTEAFLVSPVTCTDTAEFYYSCQCGAKGSETFEGDASFSHNFGESWLIGKDGHWHGCLDCGKKNDYAVHSGEICSVCSFVTEGDHFHTFAAEYKSDKDGHWHECSCGAKSGIENHSYAEVPDGQLVPVSRPCTVCGYTASIVEMPIIPGGSQDVVFVEAVNTSNDLFVAIISVLITAASIISIELIAFAVIKAAKNKKANIEVPENTTEAVENGEQ